MTRKIRQARQQARLERKNVRFANSQNRKNMRFGQVQNRKNIRTKEGRGMKSGKAVADTFKTLFNSKLAEQSGDIARGLRGGPTINLSK